MDIATAKIAYDCEVAAAKIPVDVDDLPLRYEDMTPHWLTAVLCRNAPGAQVTSFDLDTADDGNTSRRRILLRYNDEGEAAGLPASVFCKASFRFETRVSVGVCGGLECEVKFYNAVRPLIEIEAPTAYWANINTDTLNSIIMLRDMRTVQEFCSLGTSMTEARLYAQMDMLARLHARFYKAADAAAIDCLPTWPDFFTALEQIGFSGICANGFRGGEAVIPPRLFAREAEIWPATEHSTEVHRGRCDYLTHGDVHLRNWYVAGNGSMGLSDWQCSTRGHWSRDVAYAITTSTPFDARPALEKPLLAHYLKQLEASGGPAVTFQDAWQDYVEQLFGALSFWTVTLTPSADMPDMQPRDSTLEMIRRIAASIDDNAALDISRFRAG